MNEVQRKAFLDALKEDPYDEASHRAYADWLDENGFDDESLIHREWSAERQRESEGWLKEFVGKINEEYGNDVGEEEEDRQDYDRSLPGDGDGPERYHLIDYARLLELGRKALENGGPGGYYLDLTLPFDTPNFVYRDKDKFWRHLATVLWFTIPDHVELSTPVRCAC